jgi:polyisoprenoid-binding protein YceI
MLDAPHHPQLKFRSTSIAASAEKAFEVSGMLEVRGLERPATVSVTAEGLDGALAAVDGRAIVRLKDYGLKPPKAALGTIGTENEMKVEFHLAGSATTNSAGPSAQ